MTEQKTQASAHPENIILRLTGILEQIASSNGDYALDVAYEEFDEAPENQIPGLAPNLGEYGETFGAIAMLLYGRDYSGQRSLDSQSAHIEAELGFRIAQVYTRDLTGANGRSYGRDIAYFLMWAALVAHRFGAAEPAEEGKNVVS